MFGTVQAYAYRTEIDPWGMPRSVILFALASRVPRIMIDDVVSAELPCSTTYPTLHAIVARWMVHEPCDKHPLPRCRIGRIQNQCSRGYPKAIVSETQVVEDRYVYYRRRGHYTAQRHGVTIDDQWVLPYNPTLLMLFNSHINVELYAPRAGDWWHLSECQILTQ